MASSRELILGGALVLSLGANVWLARRSSEASTSTAPSSDDKATESGVATSPSPGSSSSTSARAPASGLRRPSPQLGSAGGPCAGIEAQLAEVEAELDKFLPPPERYARYARDEASEAKVKPFLDVVFTDGGKGRGYAFECHERICKVDVDRQVAREDWMKVIQSHPKRMGLTEGGAFTADSAYLILSAKDPTPNEQLEYGFAGAMQDRMTDIQACMNTHKDVGTLLVTVKLDASAHRLVLALTDSLATGPLATCVRPILEAAIAETQVPADATELTWSRPIKVK